MIVYCFVFSSVLFLLPLLFSIFICIIVYFDTLFVSYIYKQDKGDSKLLLFFCLSSSPSQCCLCFASLSFCLNMMFRYSWLNAPVLTYLPYCIFIGRWRCNTLKLRGWIDQNVDHLLGNGCVVEQIPASPCLTPR